jgi:hypothetical protein
MDIPNFKDILQTLLQKLSVVKNNTALLVPIIIGLVAILLLIATTVLSGKFREKVQAESITARGRKVDRLMSDFTTPIQPESLAAQMEAHGNDANEISALGRQRAMRDLLSYDIFPELDVNNFSGLIFVEFGQKYRAGIEGLIQSVNGRDCPTQAEIDMGLEASSARANTRRGGMYGAGAEDMYGAGSGAGGPRPRRLGAIAGGPGGMGGPRSEIDRKIVDQMYKERAASASVYVSPIDIAGYDHWLDYKYDVNMVPAVKDAWYHQLAYWVTEDIFNTISATNSGHESLLTAPIKRFQSISFTMGLKRPGSRGKKGGAIIRSIGGRRDKRQDDEESDRPAYVIKLADDGLTESLTGRDSNAEGGIDVIHFSLTLVVAAKDVPLIMQALCTEKEHKFSGYPDGSEPPQTFKHNQITILENKIGALNHEGPDHYSYRYGNDTVVAMDLICEYVFNKAGYEPIKPQVVKDTLDGLDEAG